MMDAQQAFRFGFMLRCAEEGMDESQAEKLASLAKRADPLSTILSMGWEGAKSLPVLGLAGAAGVGGLTGMAIAKAQEKPVSVEDVRRDEQIAAYNAYGDRVRKAKHGIVPQGLSRYQ
jgi:hypothetical protein